MLYNTSWQLSLPDIEIKNVYEKLKLKKRSSLSLSPIRVKLYKNHITPVQARHKTSNIKFPYHNIEIVKACQESFGFQLPSVQIAKRITKFEIQFQERSRLINL